MAEEAPARSTQPVLGTLGEFDPRTSGIASYLERVQLYFEANAVDDDRKVPVLLTVIGAKTYDHGPKLQNGTDWIPATIVSRLGPLSYLVETAAKQFIDQVKSRGSLSLSPVPTAESTWDGPGPHTGTTREHDQEVTLSERSNAAEPINTDPTAILSEPSNEVVVPAQETVPYPQRNRQVPNYYRPSFLSCHHVQVSHLVWGSVMYSVMDCVSMYAVRMRNPVISVIVHLHVVLPHSRV